MFKKFKQRNHLRFRHNEAALHELSYLFWECTLRCNLNCRHCGSDCSVSSQLPDMPFSDFLNAIKPLQKQYKKDSIIVIMTGGEPLLRNDLAECGMQLRQNGFRWGIVSNGVLYNNNIHNKLLNAGMGSVTISLDGMAATHEWMRNSQYSYDAALNAIELISSSPRLNADVVTCVNQKNIGELDQIHQTLLQSGVKSWRLFTITPIGRAANVKDLSLTDEQFKFLMEFIVEKRKDKRMKTSFSCEAWVGAYEEKVRDGFFFCRAGIHIASILADGSISACPNVDRNLAQGNIYKDYFVDVWNNKFDVMRNRSWTKTGTCANCKDYSVCEGSGLHWWHGERKEILRCLGKVK
ncbi:MAG: TIGR04133 family radical SAM/SPASM protein [Bacteroidales bacterium]|nr:TIGR04133 family radical SAM/SPASM protein [Bacteroidales bacterium]